jgi:hypothetical protein
VAAAQVVHQLGGRQQGIRRDDLLPVDPAEGRSKQTEFAHHQDLVVNHDQITDVERMSAEDEDERVEQRRRRVSKDERKAEDNGCEGDERCQSVGLVEDEEADEDNDDERDSDEDSVKFRNSGTNVLVEE